MEEKELKKEEKKLEKNREKQEKEVRKERGEKNAVVRFFGRNVSCIVATLIAGLFMFVIMNLLEVRPFGEKSFTMVDSIHQYVPFFSEFRDKLLKGDSLFYTWDVGLGQNFMSLMLYYMACPINLLVVFFSQEGILTYMSCAIAIKITLCAGTFAFYLSRSRVIGKTFNNALVVALSVAYALSNYMIGYFWNVMWLECIMMFPLIMLGFEHIIKEKDPRLYTFALFYSMFCNYYISFIICIFLVIWFLAADHAGIKDFFKNGVMFALSSILAAGMAAVSLITAYIAIMKTATAGAALPEFNWYQNIFELIKMQVFLTKPITMDTFDGNANIFAGTLLYVMLPIYLLAGNIKPSEKIKKLLVVALLFISMNQEWLNFIWHGFHNQFGIPNRFSFIYIFVMLSLCYTGFTKIKRVGIFEIGVGVVLAVIMLLATYKITGFDSVISDGKTLILSLLLVAIYGLLLMFRSTDFIPPAATTFIIAAIMIIEIIANATLGMTKNGAADGAYYTEYSVEMTNTVAAVENTAEKAGHKFYRQDVVTPRMLNENTYEGMMSVGTFCSTVRGDMVDTMARLGLYTGANEYLYKGASLPLNDLLGVRYIYVRDGDYFPAKDDYIQLYEGETTDVYENINAMSGVYAVSEMVETWENKSYNTAENFNDFSEMITKSGSLFRQVTPNLVVDGEGCEPSFNQNSPEVVSYSAAPGQDSITVRIRFFAEEAGRYYINVRANYIDGMTYTLNDNFMADGRTMTQLFDLGELKVGDVASLEVKFNSSYSPDGTISVFTSILDRDALARFRGNLMTSGMSVESIDGKSLTGELFVDNGEMIFATFPYDEGWTVYVDGEPAETLKLAGGFLGAKCEPGEHKVVFSYTPTGLKEGIIISGVSIVLYIVGFVVFTVRQRKKKKAAKAE